LDTHLLRALSTFSPAFSTGPFGLQETTDAASERRQIGMIDDGFMVWIGCWFYGKNVLGGALIGELRTVWRHYHQLPENGC
jgi:hypothetical protein